VSEVFDRPRIVTWGEMLKTLLPYIEHYPWAMDTIGDLWRMCTPTPNQVLRPDPVPTETRIIMPNDFAKWWADVQQQMGIEATPNEVIPARRSWA